MSWQTALVSCLVPLAGGLGYAAALPAPGVPASAASAIAAPAASAVEPAASAASSAPTTAALPPNLPLDLPLNWAPLDALVQAQIAATQMPGAVVLLGDAQGVQLRRAYGERSRVPTREAMTPETIFDLASVTKVVATTTAVLQLVERKKIQLDAPAAQYWPEFGTRGKGAITVRQLLAHTSGLRADIDLNKYWSGRRAALSRITDEKLEDQPGAHVLYSDINFEVLGEIVQRVSGQSLPDYTHDHIFAPLGMADTGYLPGKKLRERIAPTAWGPGGRVRRGEVHDPTAERMDGVAGHAGLFGTADDLARFAQMLLNGGVGANGQRILSADTIAALAAPQSPPNQLPWRGLGWALDAPLVARRDELPPLGLIGHTGYTGTGLWIDFATRRFVIILSNRVHPSGGGDARPLRRELLGLVATTHAPITRDELVAVNPAFKPFIDADPATRTDLKRGDAKRPPVLTGLDVLEADHFAPIAGKRIGLLTNLTGLDARGRRNIDVLRWAPEVQLTTIFTPEHGLYSNAEGRIASGVEPISGLPLVSLYGSTRRPKPEMLAGLDALVFDMQDAGVRFYTYACTMAYAMEAAAQARIPFIVLDRPNPIGADRVDGPMLDADRLSFTGCHPLPAQHGLTLGELARLINDEQKLGADLQVVPMQGYQREYWYDQTSLDWVPPSPNLRTLAQTALYPGTALVEGANVSVGRGTEHPFEWVGAPWIDGAVLARELRARKLPGVSIAAVDFTPTESPYKNQVCHGVRFTITDRGALRSVQLGIELAAALQHLYGARFELDKTVGMIGSRAVVQALKDGVDARVISESWLPQQQAYVQRSKAWWLYGTPPQESRMGLVGRTVPAVR